MHCVERSNDGLVYVCDRANDRLQVFQPDGKFVKEAFYRQEHAAAPARSGTSRSRRIPSRASSILADGQNERVRIIVRETLEEITAFGDGGRQPGQFYGVHSIATDSKGNLYTTETYEGKRAAEVRLQGHRLGRARLPGRALAEAIIEHDPEKWIPVFGKRSCSND